MAKSKTYIEIEGLNGFFACEDGHIYKDNEPLEKYKKGWRNVVTINKKEYYVDELIFKAFHGDIPEEHFVWHTKVNDRPENLKLKSYDDYNNEKTVEKAQNIATTIWQINKDYNSTLNRLETLTKMYKEATESLLTIDKENPFVEAFMTYAETLKNKNQN